MPVNLVTHLILVPATLATYLSCVYTYRDKFHGVSILANLSSFLGLYLVAWSLYVLHIYPRFICPLRSLPGPTGGYPLIGYGLSRFKKPVGSDHLQFMHEVPNDGLMRYRGFWNKNYVLLVSAEALAEVLVKRPYDFFKVDGARDFMTHILGKGLVTVEGDVHKFQRKRLLPSFGFRSIKQLYPLFWAKSTKLVQCMKEDLFSKADKNAKIITDINFWSTKVTLDMIGVAALGRDFNTLSKSDDILVQSYQDILDPTPGKIAMFVFSNYNLSFLNRFIPGGVEKRFYQTKHTLRKICENFLREKKNEAVKTNGNSTDVLSKLIDTNEFSDTELVDQLLTFIAAGHETTSSAFEWIVYLLARHPEIQSRLREELRNHVLRDIENSDTDISILLESLPLLNGVLNESLRLFPTVPMTLRTPVKPTTILGHPIPMGTEIYIVPWSINRSPEIWGPTAELFDPERWIDATTGKPNNTGGATSNYSILTFLHGPHSCIGQGFAKGELRALTANVIAAFEITVAYPEKTPIPAGMITMKPEGGMWVKLKCVQ